MKKNKINNEIVYRKCCITSSSFYIDSPFVIYDGSIYKMWYGGYVGNQWRIHYATSIDGVNWKKYGVVLDIGKFSESDGRNVYTPSVIFDGNMYHMWYSGFNGRNIRIHYATSTDGISWKKHGIVLPLGSKDESDDVHTHAPYVIYDSTIYKMWYSGYSNGHWRIHYATSKNGISWKKHGVVIPLGDEGESDSFYTYFSSIIYDGTTYKMWYTGHDGSRTKIHYATSNDGLNWTKCDLSTSPLHNFCNKIQHSDKPCIIKDGNLYKIWVNGCVDDKWGLYYTELSELILK